MDVYTSLGLRKVINAVDTYTFLGGSLMPQEVLHAMSDASKSFVNVHDLLSKAGEKLAALTHNESAFVTSGAAAGAVLTTAACVTGLDPAKVSKLPDMTGLKSEVIIHRCQRNGYDHAIRQVGVKLIEVGDTEVTHVWQLEDAISERTACIFYFAGTTFKRGALELESVIKVGQHYNVPVIVDAAAQLPPVGNLWRFTQMGASAAIFSGGKLLRGPQNSGFIVGKKSLIDACRLNASPNYSLGRPMKIGKEEIAGLLTAVELYMNLDHAKLSAEWEQRVEWVKHEFEHSGIQVERIFPGPAGQSYPRAAIRFIRLRDLSPVELQRRLAEENPAVMVGLTDTKDGIIVNPVTLQGDELSIVVGRIRDLLGLNE